MKIERTEETAVKTKVQPGDILVIGAESAYVISILEHDDSVILTSVEGEDSAEDQLRFGHIAHMFNHLKKNYKGEWSIYGKSQATLTLEGSPTFSG